MFTHLVSLKKSPWYVYAQGEQDAIMICNKYKDNVVGVVISPGGLIMQTVETTTTLVSPEVKLLERIVESENLEMARKLLAD